MFAALERGKALFERSQDKFGKPIPETNRCTVSVLLEVDPFDLVRGRRGPADEGGQLQQYVNDHPYAANNDQSCSCMTLGIVCAS